MTRQVAMKQSPPTYERVRRRVDYTRGGRDVIRTGHGNRRRREQPTHVHNVAQCTLIDFTCTATTQNLKVSVRGAHQTRLARTHPSVRAKTA